MVAETSSEMSFTIYQSTRRQIADDLHLQEANGSRVFESGGKYFDMRQKDREREREREREKEKERKRGRGGGGGGGGGNRRMEELNNEELRNFYCMRNLRRTRWIERINTCGGV